LVRSCRQHDHSAAGLCRRARLRPRPRRAGSNRSPPHRARNASACASSAKQNTCHHRSSRKTLRACDHRQYCDPHHTLTKPKRRTVHQRAVRPTRISRHAERPGQRTKEPNNAGGNLHIAIGSPSAHDPIERLELERYPLRPDHPVLPACRSKHAADRGSLTFSLIHVGRLL
jgi:hypothetical protein